MKTYPDFFYLFYFYDFNYFRTSNIYLKLFSFVIFTF